MKIFGSLSSRPSGQPFIYSLLTTVLGAQVALAVIQLDLNSEQSIKNAAKEAAAGLVSYYTGYKPGDVPGNLPDPYYWWEAGAMFGALVDYYWYTGDDQYNAITKQALMHQIGANSDYMPENQTRTLGNDDQAFWGIAAMSAAETKFEDPPEDQPQWLALAQAVWNSQVPRLEEETCGGGLRWQIYNFNKGYHYKNSISNGCFFQMGARLARYTKNDTYAKIAEQTYDWMERINLISPTYQVFDGTDVNDNCSSQNHIQWTYNNGVIMLGLAAMYNYTEDIKWKTRLDGIIKSQSVFYSKDPPDVMVEVACEGNGKCNIDQRSFKAYLARWMAATIQLAPHTTGDLLPRIKASAKAAALQCNGPGNACGHFWSKGAEYAGRSGVGEQMAAMEIFQINLLKPHMGPVDKDSGTSKGDPSAGTGSRSGAAIAPPSQITSGDRVGAGFMTTVILLGIAGGAWWMLS
ncbi:hydrolase 76 protein [Myotisia sp. PD_48]|nr:hydrolase 76 protein [Myotisia sp. PD_48]